MTFTSTCRPKTKCQLTSRLSLHLKPAPCTAQLQLVRLTTRLRPLFCRPLAWRHLHAAPSCFTLRPASFLDFLPTNPGTPGDDAQLPTCSPIRHLPFLARAIPDQRPKPIHQATSTSAWLSKSHCQLGCLMVQSLHRLSALLQPSPFLKPEGQLVIENNTSSAAHKDHGMGGSPLAL